MFAKAVWHPILGFAQGVATAFRRPWRLAYRRFAVWLALPVILAQAGCSSLGYYAQSIGGHLDLLARARPINEVMSDAASPPQLKEKLALAVEIVDFGVRVLGLPDNGSYRKYADLQRPYAVWNVVATPEFSLRPVSSCFLIVGCLSYRGYFDKDAATRFASALEADGYDVLVAGVSAYSTLGWFADPLPNTLLRLPAYRLADTLFHELAHQHSYVNDDSGFNEAFATAAGRIGTRLWLSRDSGTDQGSRYGEHLRRQRGFLELIWAAQTRLAAIYAGANPVAEKRRQKGAALAALRLAYARTKRQWDGYSGYDPWFEQGLNNAKLASVATYHKLVPAFEAVYTENGAQMPAFLAAIAALAKKDKTERDRFLAARLP